MGIAEYQVHSGFLRISVAQAIYELLVAAPTVVPRPAGLLLEDSDPRRLIPIGGRAEVTMQREPLPPNEMFTRIGVHFVVSLGGGPPTEIAPPTEATMAQDGLVVRVRLFDADDTMVDAFEVVGRARVELATAHGNHWDEVALGRRPTGARGSVQKLTGADARILLRAGSFLPSGSRDAATRALAVFHANPILARLHDRTVFPFTLGVSAGNPLDLSSIVTAVDAPIVRCGLVMNKASSGLALRVELAPDPGHEISTDLPGTVADWQSFYVQHPQDLLHSESWGFLYPSEAIVRGVRGGMLAIIYPGSPRPVLPDTPPPPKQVVSIVWNKDPRVSWRPTGGVVAVLAGLVTSVDGIQLDGVSDGVHFSATVTFDFRIENRLVAKPSGAEMAAVIVGDIRITVDLDEWDVIVTSLGYLMGVVVLTAGIGGAIGAVVGAAIGVAIAAAVGTALDGLAMSLAPRLALAGLPMPAAIPIGAAMVPVTKLDDGHYEVVIDPATLTPVTPGASLVVRGGGQEARGLALFGAVLLGPLEYSPTAFEDQRVALLAEGPLQWAWAKPCSATPQLVLQGVVSADTSYDAGTIESVRVDAADDPENVYAPHVELRFGGAGGVHADPPALARDVVIVVEVPETALGSTIYPCILRVKHGLGESVLMLAAPPPLDDATRAELAESLASRRRACKSARGAIIDRVIVLPTSDPAQWGSHGDLRDRFDVLVTDVRPGSAVVARSPGLGSLAIAHASKAGRALVSFDLATHDLGQPIELHVDGEHVAWHLRRQRFARLGTAADSAGAARAAAHSDPPCGEGAHEVATMTNPALVEGAHRRGSSLVSILAATREQTSREAWTTAHDHEGTTYWRLVAEAIH